MSMKLLTAVVLAGALVVGCSHEEKELQKEEKSLTQTTTQAAPAAPAQPEVKTPEATVKPVGLNTESSPVQMPADATADAKASATTDATAPAQSQDLTATAPAAQQPATSAVQAAAPAAQINTIS